MPRRRCVGCGRIAAKSELLRLAVDPNVGRSPRRVLIDPAGKMPGRGAYLCRGREPALVDPACLERARRRGGIARALRSSVTLERKLVESPEGGEAGRTPAGRNGDSRQRPVSPGFGRAPLSSIEP